MPKEESKATRIHTWEEWEQEVKRLMSEEDYGHAEAVEEASKNLMGKKEYAARQAARARWVHEAADARMKMKELQALDSAQAEVAKETTA